jgi:hypothetical protein
MRLTWHESSSYFPQLLSERFVQNVQKRIQRACQFHLGRFQKRQLQLEARRLLIDFFHRPPYLQVLHVSGTLPMAGTLVIVAGRCIVYLFSLFLFFFLLSLFQTELLESGCFLHHHAREGR